MGVLPPLDDDGCCRYRYRYRYRCMCVYAYVYVYVCMHECVRMCMYIFLYIYIYIYTYINLLASRACNTINRTESTEAEIVGSPTLSTDRSSREHLDAGMDHRCMDGCMDGSCIEGGIMENALMEGSWRERETENDT